MLSSKTIFGAAALAAALLAAYAAGRAATDASPDRIVVAQRPPLPAAAPHRAKSAVTPHTARSALAVPDLRLPLIPEEPADSFTLPTGNGQQSYPSPAQPPACAEEAGCRL